MKETTGKQAIAPTALASMLAKLCFKAVGEGFGLGACWFRYFNVYGPRQDP
ncbi:MAG: hypothetical protein M2R45_03659 [Verrucomicrobia subdivision 3 bacterium]|nr:hypothetical protein [Limisphaerales bacterium]MCS1412712.1 hypothetical protein [Limisphaerales bacterium]